MNKKIKVLENIIRREVRRQMNEGIAAYEKGDTIELADTGQRGKVLDVYRNMDGKVMGYNVQLSNNSIIDVTPKLTRFDNRR